MESEATTFDAASDRIWNEIVILRDSWSQYRELYETSNERITMLNACARWFFGSHQRLLLREIILGISRLTDPARTGKYDNLTLWTLLLDPQLQGRDDLRKELEVAIEAATQAAEDVRTHRHKYIAHLDRDTAIAASLNPLPRLKKSSLAEILDRIQAAYKIHTSKGRKIDRLFDLSPLGSAKALLDILEQSERWRLYRSLQVAEHTE